jgi:hypothetical protein
MASAQQAKPSTIKTPIALPAPGTDQGAMTRLFLLEALSPGMPGYVASQNLPATRLMRQTIENRLRSPAEYGARGAVTETDIIELGNQFAGFGAYPTLSGNTFYSTNPVPPLPPSHAKHRQSHLKMHPKKP